MKHDKMDMKSTLTNSTLMSQANVKQTAHDLIDQLPDEANWDQVVYELAVRRSIELGLADAKAERVISHEQLIKDLNLESELTG